MYINECVAYANYINECALMYSDIKCCLFINTKHKEAGFYYEIKYKNKNSESRKRFQNNFNIYHSIYIYALKYHMRCVDIFGRECELTQRTRQISMFASMLVFLINIFCSRNVKSY